MLVLLLCSPFVTARKSEAKNTEIETTVAIYICHHLVYCMFVLNVICSKCIVCILNLSTRPVVGTT